MSEPSQHKQRPLRVLQLVTSLRVGGIQTFLRQVRERMDHVAVAMDFAPYQRVRADEADAIEQAVEATGARVLVCGQPERPWRYAGNLANLLREHGPYDVVHAHLEQRAGLALRVARQCGVPVRIAHAHNDFRSEHSAAAWWWRRYLSVMRRWIDREATACLACSDEAGRSLYGPRWGGDARYRVLPYGIGVTPFREPVSASAVRRPLGLAEDAVVVGHVGRFDAQKNHGFLLRVFAAVCEQCPDARLLLVGDGPRRERIEREARTLGVRDRVIFAGVRDDVPRLMCGAMDCFVLPSLHEGLPMVGIEAQAAGLASVLSDRITQEIEIVPELVRPVSLDAPVAVWAEAVVAALEMGQAHRREHACECVAASPFSIETCVKTLAGLYGGATVGGAPTAV